MWATIAAQLNQVGFHFTDNEIFTLAALPGLVGATGRLIYTYLPAVVGGRNWTFISTALLLVPLIGLGNALTDTTTSYDTFVLLVAGIGIAGANFSSSMANIGFFFPKAQKGLALGINAGIGNLGVSLIYLTAPMLLGASFGGLFFSTGFINAASFRMIPFVFDSPVHASLVTGFTAAIAAYGAFFIPKLFGLSYATQGSVIPAFYFLIGFTVLTIIITYVFYARKGSGIRC